MFQHVKQFQTDLQSAEISQGFLGLLSWYNNVLLHLSPSAELHSCKVIHIFVEPIPQEGVEDVCVQYLQHRYVNILINILDVLNNIS